MDRHFYKYTLLTFVVGLLWLFTTPALAQPIDQATALQRARQFMGPKGKSITQQRRAAKIGGDLPTAYYYVFNADQQKGYVVVSGDERTPAILGYSDKGSYDETRMPQNLRSWLQHYADEIAIIQKLNITATKRAVADCGEPIAQQTTCRWDQTYPYNKDCPMVTVYSDEACTTETQAAKQAVTGCAATAMAQVLYVWKDEYKKSSTKEGKLTKDIPARPDDVWKDPILGYMRFTDQAFPMSTTIDWDNLIDDCKSTTATETNKTAVAQLIHLCGSATGMNYGVDNGIGSSALAESAGIAAYDYLGFENIRFRKQSYYPYQEWLQMLYDELKVAKAVYFTGQSSSNGHAFVIDGYAKEDLFHVNWGWGGNANEASENGGFYRINSLIPNQKGTGDATVNDGYRLGQLFVTGFYPHAATPADKPAMTVNALYAYEKEVPVEEQSCLFTVDYDIQSVSFPLIKNCQIGLCVEGNGEKHYIPMSDFSDKRREHYYPENYKNELTLTGLEDGDYQLYAVYRTNDSETAWTPCIGKDTHTIFLSIAGDKATLTYLEEYQLEVLSDNAATEYKDDEEIDITYHVKVKEGSLHDVISVYAAPVLEEGSEEEELDLDNLIESTNALEMYYGEPDTEFDIRCKFPSLKAGKYIVIAQSTTSYIDTPLGSLTVTGTNGIQQRMATNNEKTPTKVYDLSGKEVKSPAKGVVIYRQGSEVKKVILR